VGLLRCSLQRHQGGGSEKHGNGQTREHDNLIGINLPYSDPESRKFIDVHQAAR
jgi:hypothetical protein